jgi:CRP/FNR family transcriptional regulator
MTNSCKQDQVTNNIGSVAIEKFMAAYPELLNFQNIEWQRIIYQAREIELRTKTVLLDEHSICESFVFLTSGIIRVYQIAEDGREVTMYRSYPGDVCVMSLNCLMNDTPFMAIAETETPITALAINKKDFFTAIGVHENFRHMVLSSLTLNFHEMMNTLHNTVFQHLDTRLACLLGRLFERRQTNTLHITHVELANELGTTREVVSRILKQLEQQGCLELSRGQIKLGRNKLTMPNMT